MICRLIPSTPQFIILKLLPLELEYYGPRGNQGQGRPLGHQVVVAVDD